MSTFAYEYYKRNVAIVGIGLKSGEQSYLIQDKTKGMTAEAKYYTTKYSNMPAMIKCLYEAAPSFTLESGFSTEQSEFLNLINTIKNAVNAGSDVMGAVAAAAGDGGFNMETVKKMGKAGIEALSNNYEISAVPRVMRWSGQGPIDFSIKLIFLDENGGPVYFDEKIQALSALATFKDVPDENGSWTMKGPIGFNGTVSKVSQISNFLKNKNDENGKPLGLHSLILYKGDSGNRVKVLDLYKILVVRSIELKMSEQLYVKPASKQELTNLQKGGEPWKDFPAYKWITADVKFSTVCPLPSPFASTNVNVSNLYGLRTNN